jgi:2-dehydropantoate 2-reductase
MFQKAGVRCKVTDNLKRTDWEKLLWNIPFNGLGVAGAAGYDAVLAGKVTASAALGPCLPTDQLLADPKWAGLVRALMLEVIAAARGHGFEIPEQAVEDRIERTRGMGAYKASTLIDFEQGRALELESMFLEPLRRAKAVGIPTSRLEAVCQVLAALDPGCKHAAD